MIKQDYRYGGYIFYCDICGKHTHRFSTFENALKYKKGTAKSKGWICVKTAEGFKDLCNKCAEEYRNHGPIFADPYYGKTSYERRVLKRIDQMEAINKHSSVDYGHSNILGFNVPNEKEDTGIVWLGAGGIGDRMWFENYKNKLHPNDDWTNVNADTYAKWIVVIDNEEYQLVLNEALEAGVVVYLD